jgi:radical SAM superfamily enzyme YgiQ (UPF0313 family)
MGGFHPTLLPEECLEHSDAIVEGEAEYVWPQLLEDFRTGSLKRRYRADRFHDLRNLPLPRWELLDWSKYRVKLIPLLATRGCPYKCTFCEVPIFYGSKYRHRPIGEVIEDIKHMPTKNVQIVDDNITGNRDYARELFKAMIPLNIRWSCLWTINSSRDEELLDPSKESWSLPREYRNRVYLPEEP